MNEVHRRRNGVRLTCIKSTADPCRQVRRGLWCDVGLLLPQLRYFCSVQHPAGLFISRTLLTHNLDGRRTRLRAADRPRASFFRRAAQLMQSQSIFDSFLSGIETYNGFSSPPYVSERPIPINEHRTRHLTSVVMLTVQRNALQGVCATMHEQSSGKIYSTQCRA